VDPIQKKQLVSLCGELLSVAEELLLAGLATASKSTVERIDVSFKEASRMKLLRLGSTLRIANEEISRFNSGAQQFSARRLAFFLGRTWLLATGIRRALDASDDAALGKLMATPVTEPVKQIKVVMLGVGKRVIPGAFAAFEFRLRDVATREPMVFSKVFPMPKDKADLPAEAFLHLPFSPKQKWKPSILLEKKVVEITACAVSRQEGTLTRLALSEASDARAGDPFTDWKPLWNWDRKQSFERLEKHTPTPMELEIELQEEVFIDTWEPDKLASSDEGYDLMPITSQALRLEARLDRGPSGVPLHGVFKKMAEKKKRPPLYGLLHYESCQLVFQPLTALADDGPQYLTISPDKVSQAALVKAMKFT